MRRTPIAVGLRVAPSVAEAAAAASVSGSPCGCTASRRLLPAPLLRTVALTSSAHTTARRHWMHATPPRRFELDPSRDRYVIETAFEEPTFRFLCEGVDVDFKEEVRAALATLLPSPPSSFTAREGAGAVPPSSSPSSALLTQTLRIFHALCRKELVSFAQVRSTPRRLASYYETLATAHPALAMLAAEHYTFAGLVATHVKRSVRDAVLAGVDSGATIGCVAERELVAEGTPLNTEARYDAHDRCFVLRGTGKFAVVAAACAEWAIVSATLTLHKKEHNGTHLFLVQLRESGGSSGGAPGPLRPGVSVRPIAGENDVMSGCGVGVLHFEDVRLPCDHLLDPFCISDEVKVGYTTGQEECGSALDVLRTRRRIAAGAIYLGALKRLLADVVGYAADRCVVGPDYRRNYPFLGLQHIQSPLVCLVAKSYVYLAAWQRLLPVFTNPAGAAPSYEDGMRLAGTVHFLQETLMDLVAFANNAMSVHASFASTGVGSAAALVHLQQEGLDTSALIREVAFKSIARNIGTTHWGWWLTNLLQPVSPALDRFLKNPWYTPRIADLGRHLIFFSHKHYGLKKRLRRSRELERRKGGSEHQWYDWTMFRHRTVVHCGEAFMEMYYVGLMMKETEACSDPRGRKILRDVGWIYALSRQMDRLDFVLSSKMLSPGKAEVLASHLDNLVTVLAPQCVHLVDAMQVPAASRAPCHAATAMEAYWTIPGTNTHIERGDRLTLHDAAAAHSSSQRAGARGRAERAKAEQEAVRESSEEFDLFHGLADKPSYARRKSP